MAGRIVLHIGTMKSGTTYLQSRLAHHATAPDSGLDLVAGFGTQARAVKAVLAAPRSPAALAAWTDIADKARAFEGDVAIVSMEFLSFARPAAVDAFLSVLDGFEVQVVLVVRDQFGAIPAQWQTFARLRGTDAWATYLRRIDSARMRPGDEKTRAYRSFHRAQDVDVMVGRWASHPRVDRFDAITMPAGRTDRSGPRAPFDLWATFAEAAGIRPGLPEPSGLRANESLGYASCEMLRRLNVHLDGRFPLKVKRRGIRPLVADALVPRRALDTWPAFDRAGASLARRRNELFRGALSDDRVRLHGSLDHLRVPDALPSGTRVPPPDRSEVRACAAALWQRCADEVGGVRRMPVRLEARLADIAEMAPRTERWQRAIGVSSARPASP